MRRVLSECISSFVELILGEDDFDSQDVAKRFETAFIDCGLLKVVSDDDRTLVKLIGETVSLLLAHHVASEARTKELESDLREALIALSSCGRHH